MLKRKRIVTAGAKHMGTLSTSKVEKIDTARKLEDEDEDEDEDEGEEDFEPALISTEEGSEASYPELNGNGNKVSKEKKARARKSSAKTTKDENGDSIVRAPQVNSDYLPLPWKGRLGYVSPHLLKS